MSDRDSKIIQLYNSGLSLKKVAGEVGCGEATISRVLKKHSIKTRNMSKAWESGRGSKSIDNLEVIKLYESGESILSLSKKFGVSRNKINKVIEDSETSKRTLTEQRNLRPIKEYDMSTLDGDFSVENIIKTHGVSKSKAVQLRAENEITTHSGHLDIDIDNLITLHKSGVSAFELSKMYNCDHKSIILRLGDHYTPSTFGNGLNIRVSEFLKSLGVDFDENTRTIIKPLELDFYIRSHNIAIEMNGVYWHTQLTGRKNRNYHKNKMMQCRKLGIKLISFTDLDWYENEDLCKSMIKHSLGMSSRIYARKCKLVSVSPKEARVFFELNHIDGHVNASHYIGLEYQGEVVSCLSISKSRFDLDFEHEVIRFASKMNTAVIGGFSKMLKSFKTKSIMTYSNNLYGHGGVYEASGFHKISETTPGYKYYKSGKLYSRQQFQKHKLSSKLEKFDPMKTEWENMVLNGYDRIWDCGNIKWGIRNDSRD